MVSAFVLAEDLLEDYAVHICIGGNEYEVKLKLCTFISIFYEKSKNVP